MAPDLGQNSTTPRCLSSPELLQSAVVREPSSPLERTHQSRINQAHHEQPQHASSTTSRVVPGAVGMFEGVPHVPNCSTGSSSLCGEFERGARQSSAPSLYLLSLATVVNNIRHVQSLEGVPEDIAILLFWGTLRMGLMNEHVLKVFLSTRHDKVNDAVKVLGLHHGVKPVLPTRCSDRR